jgi:peptidyl-prolyl cis-trans isomerase D
LQDVASKRGLNAIETPFFASGEPLHGADDYSQLATESFQLKDGEVRAMVDGPEPYLVKLIARNPSVVPPLAEIKDLVTKAYVRVEAEKKAQAAAASMLTAIKTPGDLATVAAQNHLTVTKTGDFASASQDIPGIGQVAGLSAAVIALPKLPGLIDRVMENDGNSYIFELTSRTAPDATDWKIQGPTFTDRMLEQQRSATWINFINGLKSQADIVIHNDLIGTTQS